MNTTWKTTLLGLSLGIAANAAFAQLTLKPISSIRNGAAEDVFDESAAEIVKYDARTQQMYVVNGYANSIDIFDISSPESPELVRSVDLSAFGNPNSVAINPRWWMNEVAIAVGADSAEERGSVVFMNKKGDIKEVVSAGYLPDMLTYDASGQYLVVANEGEPNSDYSFDPEGSVTVIEQHGWSRRRHVTQVPLTNFTEADVVGVRISGPEGTAIAQDLEPEFVAIDSAGRNAYVACQENNAMVKIDLRRKRAVDIFGLGSKSHAALGNTLDVSDKDDMIRVANWPVHGLYMPDSIQSYSVGNQDYIVTANEGDGREYGDYEDEKRVSKLDLDPSAFPLAAELQKDENLGRLKILVTEGDVDGDGFHDELYSMGARSFSIFSTEGELVYDSGDFIESYLAEFYPEHFNSENDENDSVDGRSDAKGPEPEALALGEINGRTYAFVGLERSGGIMVFDITDPRDVSFVDYVNNRDFAGNAEDGTAGDLGPEGIDFIPASKSPTHQPMIAVANEVSGTTTLYTIDLD
ncbi:MULTISPECIES: choice-of-anchor I family protein [unclassified Lentimonas]|uniref:choice-of-anchor I family protein n=1 Tax=unclassified Lentimonas TaxID=2630993 RepID=UPI0013262979|nr:MULTISPECIES: choice-of-anchor I family protein [unclassified Lentimonas]CAA6678883.1 Alkaline phosphatase (EC [Lentimonas sp. CC4]CAA6684487.1 Alkaline phosphatase (EC [Lentimonas sp. CC6]CAA7077433.1 Alkaline phosphatase (EC [Lentimonas sp. CC4]CAA7171268.1 Alkaline phosphatase (EC [Lentimonas sp. CC21]CAA7183298.1 Alkaline phosphatase (EC [Lentimonas sp. CC8]